MVILEDLGVFLWMVISRGWLIFTGVFLVMTELVFSHWEPVKKYKKNISKILIFLTVISLLVAMFLSYHDVMIKLRKVKGEYGAYKGAQEKTKDEPHAVVSKLDWKPDRQELVMIVLNPSKSEDYVNAAVHLGLITYNPSHPLRDKISWHETEKENINRGGEPRLFEFKIPIEIDQMTVAIILIKSTRTMNGYELAVWYTWDKGNTWAPWAGNNALYRVSTDDSLKIQNTIDEIKNDLKEYSKEGNYENYFKKNS